MMNYPETNKWVDLDELAELLANNPDLGIEQGTLDGAADYLQTDYMPPQPDSVTTTNVWQPPAGRGKRAKRIEASGSDVLHESEKDFQSWVIDLLKTKGYRVAHFRPGMTSRKDRYGKPVWVTPMIGDPGFPDIVAAKQGFPVLFIELKTDKGHLTRGQKDWIDALDSGWAAEYSHVVHVWRPCHRDLIEELLG